MSRFNRFDTESPCFFTPAIHSRVVQFILDRTRFEEGLDNNFAFGMERLIADNVYEAAYPLHDVRIKLDIFFVFNIICNLIG